MTWQSALAFIVRVIARVRLEEPQARRCGQQAQHVHRPEPTRQVNEEPQGLLSAFHAFELRVHVDVTSCSSSTLAASSEQHEIDCRSFGSREALTFVCRIDSSRPVAPNCRAKTAILAPAVAMRMMYCKMPKNIALVALCLTSNSETATSMSFSLASSSPPMTIMLWRSTM